MSEANELEALRAQVAALQAENKALTPTLRTRVGVTDLLKAPDNYLGRVIGVAGWVRTARVQGKGGSLAFVKLYDGAGAAELQIVMDGQLENFAAATKGSTGASLFVTGEIVASKGREQAIEMVARKIEILGLCPAAENPLAKAALPLEYLREVAHLRARTTTMGAAARIRNCLAFAVHEFFQNQGYFYVHTPMITASDCEGAGEMFQVTTLLKHGKLQANMKERRDFERAEAAKRAEAKKAAPADASAAEEAAPAEEEKKDERTDEELERTADYAKDFFGREAFLTVSGQLNGETYATALSKIYTFGPTFRAENSHTTRHLSEFWMIEPEIAFADLQENMEIAEAFIKFCIKQCLTKCDGDMKLLEVFERKQIEVRAKELADIEKKRRAAEKKRKDEESRARREAKKLKEAEDAKAIAEGRTPEPAAEPEEKKVEKKEEKKPAKKDNNKKGGKKDAPQVDWRDIPLRQRLMSIVDAKFARVTYTEAISIVSQAAADGKVTFVENVQWGDDMGSEHERYLCERHFKRPTIVTDYPKSFKAFYMRANPDGKTVAAMDILVPGVGELIGGSQREERMPELLEMMKYKDLDPKDFSWYLDLRRYGSVPHAGFGLGFERLVNYTTGLDNIRDVIPFPRYPGHATF